MRGSSTRMETPVGSAQSVRSKPAGMGSSRRRRSRRSPWGSPGGAARANRRTVVVQRWWVSLTEPHTFSQLNQAVEIFRTRTS